MRRHRRAFTLIEILIVVVILGILAALVIPNFSLATQESVKGTLSAQMQVVESQYDLYLMRGGGLAPPIGSAAGTTGNNAQNGWDILVSSSYLLRTPVNGYTGTSNLVDAPGATPNMPAGEPVIGLSDGWGFRPHDFLSDPNNPMHAKIFAMGYDETNNLLSREAGYTTVVR